MARLTDIYDPAERKLAEKIPPDILERLSAAELRLRVKHAAYLSSHVNRLTPTDRKERDAHITRLLRSQPVAEYIHEQRERNRLAANAGSGTERMLARESAKAYRETSAYPPGLEAAVNMHLLGKQIPDPALAEAAQAAVNHAA